MRTILKDKLIIKAKDIKTLLKRQSRVFHILYIDLFQLPILSHIYIRIFYKGMESIFVVAQYGDGVSELYRDVIDSFRKTQSVIIFEKLLKIRGGCLLILIIYPQLGMQ